MFISTRYRPPPPPPRAQLLDKQRQHFYLSAKEKKKKKKKKKKVCVWFIVSGVKLCLCQIIGDGIIKEGLRPAREKNLRGTRAHICLLGVERLNMCRTFFKYLYLFPINSSARNIRRARDNYCITRPIPPPPPPRARNQEQSSLSAALTRFDMFDNEECWRRNTRRAKENCRIRSEQL